MEMMEKQNESEDEELSDHVPRGRMLWIRGLTRLQNQVINCRSIITSLLVINWDLVKAFQSDKMILLNHSRPNKINYYCFSLVFIVAVAVVIVIDTVQYCYCYCS